MIVSLEIGFKRNDEDGTMKASVDVPEGEVTVTELLPVLQSLTSRIVNGVISDDEVSCRAGCAACCRQVIPISIFEAEGLASWIRTLPLEDQEALQGRFAVVVHELRTKGLLELLQTDLQSPNQDAIDAAGLDYLRAWVACPFLVNESCSIHPIRPLLCREYVVTSPAEFCATPWDRQVVGVSIPVQLSKALLRLGKKVDVDGLGWIPLVLLFEWMKDGGEPGQAIRGTGQQVMGAVLNELQR